MYEGDDEARREALAALHEVRSELTACPQPDDEDVAEIDAIGGTLS